ncbi:MAG: iron complex outerrane recepter protein [Gammaproteobacteria bacterium]|nr:iron complex outerrane recepter protein [Gammaproteobacteria bacterium]
MSHSIARYRTGKLDISGPMLAAGFCIAATLIQLPMSAQGQTPGAVPSSSGGLDEVVVTANKLNTQRVLDIPTSIQAISGDALKLAGDTQFMDIAGDIPGLSVQDLGPGDKKYVIRGINSTGDSTIGLYYGEAVISGSNANDGGGFTSDIRLYDLDRIEVLRGPQGTLYGASSMSGTIRFIPKSPDLNSMGGYLSVEGSATAHGGGNYNVNGEGNLPLIDGVLALRLVGWETKDSGYIDQIRVGTVGLIKGVNNDDVAGGRAILRYQPNEALNIEASYTGQKETSNGSSRYTPAGVQSWGTTPDKVTNANPIPKVFGCDLCNTDVTQSPWVDNLSVYGLKFDYKFAGGTLTGTTNQYNRKLNFNFDSTPILVSFGVPVPAESMEPQTRNLNSSELRYASAFDSPVNFVAGVYRQYETNNLIVNVITTDDLGLPSGPFSRANSQDALNFPGVGHTFFGRTDDRTTTEYAGFGEVTWKLTDVLTATGGLRYFTEKLEGVQEQTHPFGGFPPSGQPGPIADPSQTFNKVTWKENISYKLSDGLLAYETVSTGFRGGGLNAVSEPFEPIPRSFSPDNLINFEVGAKGRLAGGMFDYQADVYLIRWNNIQVNETTADGAFNYTGNAGTAKVKGVEFEFGARPIEYFRASIAGSYQHAYLTQGATAAQKLANPTLGVTGEDIPNVPKFQADVGLNYTRPINSAWNGMVAADANYRGAVDSYFASNKFNIPLSSYTLVNLRTGVQNNLWSITAFARNLTNKRAQVSAINSSQDPEALLTVRPRTIGVTVNRNF